MIAKLIIVLFVFETFVQGISESEINSQHEKIVGGIEVTAGENPWQVSIQSRNYGGLMCSGTIISNIWILTTALCASIDPVFYVVRAGTRNYRENGTIHEIIQVIPHENNLGSVEFDIAVEKISPTFIWNDMTAPISLPLQGTFLSAGTMVWVSGWGAINYIGEFSEILRKVTLPIIDEDTCDSYYPEYNGVPSDQICIGLPEGGKGPCGGDDGGPLYLEGVLYGVYSWSGCGGIDHPAVFTNVATYRDWIATNTGV